MKRGIKPIAIFELADTTHMNEIATSASNKGAYAVESLCPGLMYFFYGDRLAIASGKGSMTVHISTAEVIVEELADILEDYKDNLREGRTPMDSRSIGKMLQEDFT